MVSIIAIIMHAQKDSCKSVRICKKLVENLNNLLMSVFGIRQTRCAVALRSQSQREPERR